MLFLRLRVFTPDPPGGGDSSGVMVDFLELLQVEASHADGTPLW